MRVTAWVALVVALTACGPRAGGSCSQEDTAVCQDDDSMLVCEKGRYREIPCRGQKGCVSNSQRVDCDQSGNRPGDSCTRRSEGATTCTSADRHSRLTCKDGVWTGERCILECSTINNSTVCI